MFETFSQVDASVSVVMGVHQSIGMKGIVLFGSDEQKERFLPDLAAGRKLAAFALTEPEAGSDAYHLKSRAVRQSDGSWLLNGEKRYIGNGSKAGVIVTFARAEVDGKDRHIALILTPDMEGFEVGERYDTMGLRGNDVRHLYYNDIRVPPENVLGEPGEGFQVAMEVLNNGRLSLGTGSVGAAKKFLDVAIEHVTTRRQFDRPLAEFELVPVGEGYLRDHPYEQALRDIRVFPIFEGANDVLRAFIALTGLKPLGEKLQELQDFDITDPIRSLGVVADYVGGRIKREVRPERLTLAHDELSSLADPISDQVKQLAAVSEKALHKHGKDIILRQFIQKRIADAVADIYAQVAVLSRVTSIFEDQGVEVSGQERYIAETFCTRAAGRVQSNLRQVEDHDDDRMTAIAKLAYKRGNYGYALFED